MCRPGFSVTLAPKKGFLNEDGLMKDLGRGAATLGDGCVLVCKVGFICFSFGVFLLFAFALTRTGT